MHLELAFEAAFRAGAKPVPVEIVDGVLSRAIDETGGDRTAMSRLLGLERNTLRYKLNKYDLLKRT